MKTKKFNIYIYIYIYECNFKITCIYIINFMLLPDSMHALDKFVYKSMLL